MIACVVAVRCGGSRAAGGQAGGAAGTVGHGRPGGLRQTAAALLPRHRRAAALLLDRQPRQSGERGGEVGRRDPPLLSQDPRHPRRHQEGPATRRPQSAAARRAEGEGRYAGGGSRDGRQHRRRCVPRVLGEDARGRAGRVRGGRQGGAAAQARRAQTQAV